MDLAESHRRSVVEFVDRVRRIGAGQWSLPTPCADWNVRELVNHVVGEDEWTVPLMDGATIAEVDDRFDGDLLGADPVAAARRAGDAAVAAMSAPEALTRTVHLSFGDTPAEEYCRQLLADHLIHAWDVAAAVDGDRRLDPALVSACAEWFCNREQMYRGAGVIGERVDVPENADAQALLLAAFGRYPGWTAPA